MQSLNALLGREKSVSEELLYTTHASEHNVRTSRGDVLTTLKLDGIFHEAADDTDVELWHEQLASAFDAILEDDVAIWRHTHRRSAVYFPEGEFHGVFAKQLNEKYRKRFTDRPMMVNDLYITVVLRAPSKLGRKSKKGIDDLVAQGREQSERLDNIATALLASLDKYKPRRLGTVIDDGKTYSEPKAFLGFLVNGVWQKMPYSRHRIGDVITTSRITFGVETGEVRAVNSLRYFAMLSVNEYPENTWAGLMNKLLSLPFEYLITHSFAGMSKAKAMDMISRQEKKMINLGDAGVSQVEALRQAMDHVASGRLWFGGHHFSMLILAPTEADLSKCIAWASTDMQSDFTVVREDLCLEAAYWAQLPGNFHRRPRVAPISSRNFAGLASMHNYPVGQAAGNMWGPALTVVQTTSNTPFYLNLHVPFRRAKTEREAASQEKVVGNTVILGPTGGGKTVTQTFLLAQAEKYSPTVFTLDKDCGQENFIRGLGGKYSVLRNGMRTGFNPWHCEDTPRNRLFLEKLVAQLVSDPGQPVPFHWLNQITTAVAAVMDLPLDLRNMTACLSYLNAGESEGVYDRLSRWCEEGPLGWVFDNPKDTLHLKYVRHFGFDVTDFLKNEQVRAPILMYLFHRMDDLLGKRRFILNVDETPAMLANAWLEEKIGDLLMTIRKLDGLTLLSAQSPKSLMNTKIAHLIVQQSPTQIYVPNPRADYDDYTDGFNVTDREFKIIKVDMPEKNLRGFLYKQTSTSASTSVVCKLDLSDFQDELAILSSNADSAALARKIVEETSEDPAIWMPIFHQKRKGL